MDEIQGVQYEGILAHGYGLIPKLVTRDKNLSIEAKAIYAYLAAFAGNTQEAFPGVSLICDELNISKKRYLSHRKALVERGYIEIKRERQEDGNGFSKNIYVLKQNIPYGVDSLPYETLPYQNVGLGGVTIQNDATNSNSININSSINNKENNSNKHTNEHGLSIDTDFAEVLRIYEQNFGLVSGGFDQEDLGDMVDNYKKDLIIEAIKEARSNQNVKKPLRLISKILKNWAAENIHTTIDLQNYLTQKEREQHGQNNRRGTSRTKKQTKYPGLANYNSQMR